MSNPADTIREALADLPAHGLQAEALAALTELEQVTDGYARALLTMTQKKQAAEADRDRLADTLREIDAGYSSRYGGYGAGQIARAALDRQETTDA
jgi:hypothetical protein